jgi:hypothetical protein
VADEMKVSDKILRRFFPAGVLLGSTGESENSLTFDATRPGPPLPKVPTALFPVADWEKTDFMPCSCLASIKLFYQDVA